MTSPKSAVDLQAMWAELKANRQTQVALLAFLGILTWMLWPEAPKTRRAASGSGTGNAYVDPKALASLRQLPDLAALDQAGEIPAIPKLLRDPFLFEAPRPTPPPPKPQKVEPPPPKSQPQIEAEALEQAKREENNTRPQDLRYLGYLKGTPAGQIGAFMKGEEAQTLTLGTQVKDRWKLVELTDRKAVFLNTRFGDLRFELVTRDSTGGNAPGAGTVTNEY